MHNLNNSNNYYKNNSNNSNNVGLKHNQEEEEVGEDHHHHHRIESIQNTENNTNAPENENEVTPLVTRNTTNL